MSTAARKYGIPIAILYAVALTETGDRGSLQALAMNIDGASVFPASLPDALARFRSAKQNGAKLIDIGCMQVNERFHRAGFASMSDMFEPSKNVDYAARFLRALRDREGSWTSAVARYHAGPGNAVAQGRYICSVIGNLAASGFGSWTTSARVFCNQRPRAAGR